MSDIINLLPDSVANQIAAGEVVQRPASVVKELVENAIDAGASMVKVNIKDAGRTLIQVIDNGCGMSETDVRMAFERHATSKINSAEDIFAIRTMGFRGEALASIAAVAQVELRSKMHENELGTALTIHGSEVISQESIQCPNGSNFMVKNLFYNIPARRKFLKSNNAEFRQIQDFFQRIVLTYPEVGFILQHNDKEIYNLPKERNLKSRIVRVFGKKFESLIPIDVETSLAKVTGFIGTPDHTKKKGAEQFFFVNNRYMRHLLFHRRAMKPYEGLIASDANPAYFVYFELSPDEIDVNIHPTKTEIKFTNEWDIAQVLEAGMRQALGKANMVPSIDFEDNQDFNDMFSKPTGGVNIPSVTIQKDYNPFESQSSSSYSPSSAPKEKSSASKIADFFAKKEQTFEQDWSTPSQDASFDFPEESEPTTFESAIHTEPEQQSLDLQTSHNKFIQIKNRYIGTPVKSGLMLINQKRAHERILYEEYLQAIQTTQPTQNLLYPETFNCNQSEYASMIEFLPILQSIGYDIEEFGSLTFVIRGVPADMQDSDISAVLHTMLNYYLEGNGDVEFDMKHKVAWSLARASAIGYGTVLDPQEMQKLTDELFRTESPNVSPSGKKVITILDLQELQNKF